MRAFSHDLPVSISYQPTPAVLVWYRSTGITWVKGVGARCRGVNTQRATKPYVPSWEGRCEARRDTGEGNGGCSVLGGDVARVLGDCQHATGVSVFSPSPSSEWACPVPLPSSSAGTLQVFLTKCVERGGARAGGSMLSLTGPPWVHRREASGKASWRRWDSPAEGEEGLPRAVEGQLGTMFGAWQSWRACFWFLVASE